MKLLGIHYFAPPTAVVASRRLSGLYRYLIEQGVTVDLITSANHLHKATEESYRIAANYHFADGHGIRELLAGPQNSALAPTQKQGQLFTLANRYRQSFPFLSLTDEGGPAYFRNAVRQGQQIIPEQSITHILSSYRPWVDHRIAAALKAKFPNLYWIADFRDLPVDSVRNDIGLAKYQGWIGKRKIRSASEVWVVSEGQKAQLKDWHPNIRVVYNGLQSLPKPSSPPQTDRFVINYSGSFYPGLQDLGPLREGLRSVEDSLATSCLAVRQNRQALVKKISLHYTGKDVASWNQNLYGNPSTKAETVFESCTQAPVDQATARRDQSEADTNLLLSWSAPGYYGVLTAKLFDYLAAGRPITALVNGPDDPELRRIVEGSGAGRVFCRGQEAALADWLVTLLKEWQKNEGILPWQTEGEKLRYLLPEEQLKGLFLRP